MLIEAECLDQRQRLRDKGSRACEPRERMQRQPSERALRQRVAPDEDGGVTASERIQVEREPVGHPGLQLDRAAEVLRDPSAAAVVAGSGAGCWSKESSAPASFFPKATEKTYAPEAGTSSVPSIVALDAPASGPAPSRRAVSASSSVTAGMSGSPVRSVEA